MISKGKVDFEAPGGSILRPREVDFKAPEWVDFKAPERRRFSGPGEGRFSCLPLDVDFIRPGDGVWGNAGVVKARSSATKSNPLKEIVS